MQELFAGVYCWKGAYRPGASAYSVWVAGEGENVLIDPLTPEEGLSQFSHPSKNIYIVLTTANHERAAQAFKLALRAEVWAPEKALTGLDRAPDRVYSSGEELPCAIQALMLEGSHTEGETALLIPRGPGILVLGDALVARPEGEWRCFRPQEREALQPLLGWDFDALITSHGEPVLSGAKEQLRTFLAQP